jgi:TPR repeat protein
VNRAPRFLLLLPIIVLQVFPVSAQESSQSPVFKSYRPPRPGALVEQSDVTYQMWQTFHLTQQANAGDGLAQHELGIRYLVGKGVQADTVRGAYWTEQAAAQRIIPAQFNLGILLMNGWGVAWNPFAAFPLFERAARAGMEEAQYLMATMYLDNLIVPRDYSTALAWATAAADSGYQPARTLCDELRPRVAGAALQPSPPAPQTHRSDTVTVPPAWSPVFLAFDTDTAADETERTFLERVSRNDQQPVQRLFEGLTSVDGADSLRLQRLEAAADAGSPEALMALAWRAIPSDSRTGDPVRAAEYLVRAVRHEAPYAAALLWDHLEDPDAAAALVRAVRSRDPRASYIVATLQAIGVHPPLLGGYAWLPEEDALGLLKASSGAGFRPAVLELGLCYYTGRWVRRDVGEAMAIWDRVAQGGDIEANVRRIAAMIQEGGGDPSAHLAQLDQAIAEGSVLAQVAAGLILEQGVGGKSGTGAAVRYYRDAASRGSQDAFRALLRLHDERRPADPRFSLPSGG